MNRLLFCLLCLFSISHLSLAQTTNNSSQEAFSFFKDETNKVFYIDFESIDINLSEIIVKDEEGKIILEEAVNELPVDAIYELDCSQFQNGEYIVELHSYTAVLRRPFSLE